MALLVIVPTLASAQGGWPFRGLCENGKKDVGEVDVDCEYPPYYTAQRRRPRSALD